MLKIVFPHWVPTCQAIDNLPVALLCSCHYLALDQPSHHAEISISNGFKVLASGIKKSNHPICKPTESTYFLLATVCYSEPVLNLFSRQFQQYHIMCIGVFWVLIVEGFFFLKPQSINLITSWKSDVRFLGQDALSLQPR